MQLDEVMGTATAVAGRVGEQSRIFENIGNKVLAVGAKFPAINGIINAVRRKKSKVSLEAAWLLLWCLFIAGLAHHDTSSYTMVCCRTQSFWHQSLLSAQFSSSSTG